MAHLTQQRFLCLIRSIYPSYFKYTNVLDVGSANIYGSNRFLFKNVDYFGIDLWPGKNVYRVMAGKDVTQPFNTVICTEVLEHDEDWKYTLLNMARIAQKCLIITVATTNRPEHGTARTTPKDSPFKDVTYYKNLTIEEIEPLVKGKFYYSEFFIGNNNEDLYFIGFKNRPEYSPSLLTFIRLYCYRFLLNRLHDFKEGIKRLIRL